MKMDPLILVYTRGPVAYTYVDEGTLVIARIHEGGPCVWDIYARNLWIHHG
jgi:hypothetical protein